MRRPAIIVTHFLTGFCMLGAQVPNPWIENVRTNYKDNRLEIRYDIIGSRHGTPHRIDLVVVDNMGNIVYPDSVSGDIGPEVMPGSDKLIIWDIYKEFDVVYGDFTPTLTIDAVDNRKRMRGPEYAALSLLLPGLGDYFVADADEMKLKPCYKTAFTFGILGLSWLAIKNRDEIPPVMAPPGYYISTDAPPGEKFLYIDHYWMKEPASTDYWIFPYDAEIILGIGIASWLFDVIWVARKGLQNNKIRNNVLKHMSLIPSGQGLMLSYRIQ